MPDADPHRDDRSSPLLRSRQTLGGKLLSGIVGGLLFGSLVVVVMRVTDGELPSSKSIGAALVFGIVLGLVASFALAVRDRNPR